MMKKAFWVSIIGVLLIIILFFLIRKTNHSGQPVDRKVNYIGLSGQTMGAIYNIQLKTELEESELKKIVDSLMVEFNNSLSTYIPGSTISRFNRSEASFKVDHYLKKVFLTSKEVHEHSEGAFDPTVMPLVNAWGFGFENRKQINERLIDSLLDIIGFEKVIINNEYLVKEDHRIMLDFSAIAKGYGVDVICDFFDEHGIQNYMVEIGGEVRAKGKNKRGTKWVIAIEEPNESIESQINRRVFETVEVGEIAIATSGNYRKFYIDSISGKKFAHTIDPFTGYPVDHNLLSVTVVNKSCMIADAYATAFMVLGVEKVKKLLPLLAGVDAFLIYEDDNGEMAVYYSDGFSSLLSKPAGFDE